jgi:hypothetical protein
LDNNPALFKITFGVFKNTFGVLKNTFGVLKNTSGVIQNTFGVFPKTKVIEYLKMPNATDCTCSPKNSTTL